MALTGTFRADFAPFYDAVTKAEKHLVDFSAGADRAGVRLNAMQDSFSGKAIIQQATLMAEAVERVGGVSKLTEKELARVGVTANEATAKMRAMGIDVPPGLQKIADETKSVDSATGTLTSTVKQLAVGFAAMFTARAAFNFVKDTVNEASALKDLGQQTHINVEELQLLAGAMSEFGVDADELGRGLFRLSRQIAGGDESVTHGLHLMGMSLKDVEGLNGQELFLKIERGLATLQGGLRDTAAAELYGGKLGAAMAGASEGIDEALASARQLNTVMSGESVDALDQYGESIERAQRSLSAMAANLIGPVAQGFNAITEAVASGNSFMAVRQAMTKDMLSAALGLGTGTEHLARLLDEQNQKTEAGTKAAAANAQGHKDVAAAIDTRSAAVKFMAALEADAAVTLSAAQIKDLEHLKEIGALNARNAEGIGVSGAQYAKYTAEVERTTKATKAHADAIKILADIEKISHGEALAHQKGWRDEIQKTLDLRNTAVIAGAASIQRVEAELADVLAKQWMKSTDFQIMKIWEVAAADKASFQGSLEQRAQYNAAVEALAQEQENAILASIQRVVTAEEAMFAKMAADAVTTFAVIGKGADEIAAKVEATSKKVQADFNQANPQYSLSGGTPSTPESMHKYQNSPAGLKQGILDRFEQFQASMRNSPQFGSGGPTQAGMAMLHDGEYVVPKDGALVSGGGGTTVNINMSGILLSSDASAKQALRETVSAAVMDAVSRGRKLPSA